MHLKIQKRFTLYHQWFALHLDLNPLICMHKALLFLSMHNHGTSAAMWLTDLLRKMTQGPNVGETFRDYIGCYLYGTEGRTPKPEYLGAPTTLPELEQGLRAYLQDYVRLQPDSSASKVQQVQALINDLPARLQAHVNSDMNHPFLEMDGTVLFVRKGIRQRRKNKGKFVE